MTIEFVVGTALLSFFAFLLGEGFVEILEELGIRPRRRHDRRDT